MVATHTTQVFRAGRMKDSLWATMPHGELKERRRGSIQILILTYTEKCRENAQMLGVMCAKRAQASKKHVHVCAGKVRERRRERSFPTTHRQN